MGFKGWVRKLARRGKKEVKQHRAQDKSARRAVNSMSSIERVLERSTKRGRCGDSH